MIDLLEELEEHKKRIEDTVKKIEKECQSEVIPMVVGQSDDYPGARWRLALTFSLLMSFFISILFPNLSPIYLLISQFFSLWIGHWMGLFPLLRFFLVKHKTKEEVHERALKAFFEKGVHQTKKRIGILIFVSLLERRAEILCDTAIHKKVDQKEWDLILNRLLEKIKSRQLIEGLEITLLECGELVKKHFPIETGQEKQNELSNQFLISKN